MDYDLTDDYLADVEKRCRRYQGQWCGSVGSYAADAMRLLLAFRKQKQEIAAMQDLLDANQKLRDAVEARLSGGCCDGGKCHANAIDTKGPLPDPDEVLEEGLPPDWILQGQRELEAASDDIRWKGDGVIASTPDGLRPGSREFVDTLEEIKQLHLRKTLDYGVDDDALSNIRESAEVVNMPSWAGAILRISDKMHRLKAYFRRGKVEFDGIEDTLKDIASYAAIALVLYRETTAHPVTHAIRQP